MMKLDFLTVILFISFVTAMDGVCQSSRENGGIQMNFNMVHQYRNNILNPTWYIYKRNYQEDPVSASLPRFVDLNGNIVSPTSRTEKGIKIAPDSDPHFFKTFSKLEAPCVLLKLHITEHSKEHRIMLGVGNDEDNVALLSCIQKQGREYFIFELKQDGKNTINKTFNGFDIKNEEFTLFFLLGNDDFSFFIKTRQGVQRIGMVANSRTMFTQPEKLKLMSPMFGGKVSNNGSLSIGSFDAGYFEGIGHADVRSVTYENGEPVRNEKGNFYISTSARLMGKNGGSGGICVYEIDNHGRIIRPVSLIVAQNETWIEAGTAAKLVFDRKLEQWLYVARAFPSPGGSIHIGITNENLIHDGLHIVTCKKHRGILSNSLDGDLIQIKNDWYLAYHGGNPRRLHIAKSRDLKKWEEISETNTGEGISIFNRKGEFFIIDATSQKRMNIRRMFQPSEVVGAIDLKPSPGNSRRNGGYPWGTLIPIERENGVQYLMICFSMDEYIESNNGDIFTYGDLYSYLSDIH
ncbi:hypothetical protein EYV94_26680 [Puteibacter caeruleilacunae]|nr:hypothetical protein EYV94_26680 [Puteibacter caeruleilacunae]